MGSIKNFADRKLSAIKSKRKSSRVDKVKFTKIGSPKRSPKDRSSATLEDLNIYNVGVINEDRDGEESEDSHGRKPYEEFKIEHNYFP